ncbi:MAG TPA: site-2 protease family protein [Stellaceae bacterium]
MQDYSSLLVQISVFALPAIFAITLHEAAHGFVANKLGDDTALRAGRVTFNPLKHIDPFGTVLMPLLLFFVSRGSFLFGYAKPVPVNFSRLNHPRMDMVWVALAGPGINILMAIGAALLFYVIPFVPTVAKLWAALNLRNAVMFNVVLAVFNMIPLPPLDGGRVAVGLLPNFLARPLARLERYGIVIVIGVLFLLPWIGREIGVDLDIVSVLIYWPANTIVQGIGWLTGVA